MPPFYLLTGPNPKLLLISGLHGDEYEVIDTVSEYIKLHLKELPPLLYIPIASPSAVATHTRQNNLGHDLNRSFFDDSIDPEIKNIIKTINNNHFNLCLCFHEHPGHTEFYYYDSQPKSEISGNFLNTLSSQNFNLFTGNDDPDDPVCNFQIQNGYIHIPFNPQDADFGTIWDWGLKKRLFNQVIETETPGAISIDKKRLITDTIFNKLIIPTLK
jgi:hypothetical protein